MKDSLDVLKSLYTTIFSVKFNSEGTELAAADNFGHIGVYKLHEALSADQIDKTKPPYFKFKVADSSLYCLESTKSDVLVCAPINEIGQLYIRFMQFQINFSFFVNKHFWVAVTFKMKYNYLEGEKIRLDFQLK
jgi:hypothetical protein